MISRQLFDAMHRKKSLSEARYNSGDGDNDTTSGLRKSLNAVDLILYGLGSAVGAGIYILAGIGAKLAGPAISLSFLGCGLSCTLTALAYAEFSSLIPASGSAYIYTYVAFGEVYAFCVGWNLILGYGFTASVAARAWADYIGDFMVKMTGADWIIPYCTEVPLFSSIWTDYTCSPLSVVIVLVSTIVLLRGTKDSSTFNNLICVTNLSILALIVVSALVSGSVEATDNLTPFAPSGMPGILRGAGLVFYAFIGFDMVASLSEEVIHPEKNMPIGIVGSLLLSTLIYCGVTLVVVGMTPLPFLGETTPLVNAILANACCSHSEQMEVVHAGEEAEVCLKDCPAFEKPVLAFVSRVVSGGAGFGLMAACFTSLMGQPRIFYRMALDGLWFPLFARYDFAKETMEEGHEMIARVVSRHMFRDISPTQLYQPILHLNLSICAPSSIESIRKPRRNFNDRIRRSCDRLLCTSRSACKSDISWHADGLHVRRCRSHTIEIGECIRKDIKGQVELWKYKNRGRRGSIILHDQKSSKTSHTIASGVHYFRSWNIIYFVQYFGLAV